jgi:hypothetical protein
MAVEVVEAAVEAAAEAAAVEAQERSNRTAIMNNEI